MTCDHLPCSLVFSVISVAGPSPTAVEAVTLNVYSVKGFKSDTRYVSVSGSTSNTFSFTVTPPTSTEKEWSVQYLYWRGLHLYAALQSGVGGSYAPTCATRNCCAACWKGPCNCCAMRGWEELAWGQCKTGGKGGFTPSLWLPGQPGWKRSRRHRSGRKDSGPRDCRASRLKVCAERSRRVIGAGFGKMWDRGIDRQLRIGVSQLIAAVSGTGGSHPTGQGLIRKSGREGQRWGHQAEINASLTSVTNTSRDRLILIQTGRVLKEEQISFTSWWKF